MGKYTNGQVATGVVSLCLVAGLGYAVIVKKVHDIRMRSADHYERKLADQVSWDHKSHPLQAVEKQKRDNNS